MVSCKVKARCSVIWLFRCSVMSRDSTMKRGSAPSAASLRETDSSYQRGPSAVSSDSW